MQQVYFRPGETVPASRPIIALLPPGNIKVRFYVAEAMLARIAIGDEVRVHCDGCAERMTAQITFISRNAEYTPPVIYSLEERQSSSIWSRRCRKSPRCCASASRSSVDGDTARGDQK